MLISHPQDLLAVAHERAGRLHAEAKAERMCRPRLRHTLAATLRRAADRLEPTTPAWRTALGDGR